MSKLFAGIAIAACLFQGPQGVAWQAPASCATLDREGAIQILCGDTDSRAKIAELTGKGLAFPVDLKFIEGASVRCGVQPEEVVTALFRTSRPACLPSPPVIERFAAVPPRVVRGQTAQLQWAVKNAERVELEGHEVPASGSRETPILTHPTDFVLRAFASGGTSAARATVIEVDPAPEELLPDGPPLTLSQIFLLVDTAEIAGAGWNQVLLAKLVQNRLASFRLTPESQTALEQRGASAELINAVISWRTPSATAEGRPVNRPLSREDLELVVRVRFPEKTVAAVIRDRGISFEPGPSDTRMIRASAMGGIVITALNDLISSALPPVIRIDADPLRAVAGQSVTVSWSVAGAQSVRMNQLSDQELEARGTRVFTVQRDAVFTISATNLGKRADAGVTVKILKPQANSGIVKWQGKTGADGTATIGGFPGFPVTIEVDPTRWTVVRKPEKATDYRFATIKSVKPGVQHNATAIWRIRY